MHAMTDADRAWHATWRPASGHPSGKWRVVRQFFPPLAPAPSEPRFQELNGPSGKIRLFRSRAAAERAAAIANGETSCSP